VLPSLAAGVLLTMSVPPMGFWPLAFAGFALLYWRLAGLTWRWRLVAGAAAGLGLFGPGIYWITDFQEFGYIGMVLLETSFVVLAAVVTPPKHGRALAFPAAVVLGELARNHTPWGGFPLGGVVLGQVSGPLAPAARVGGPLLVLGLAAAAGVAITELVQRRWPVTVAVAVIASGTVAWLLRPAPVEEAEETQVVAFEAA